MPHIIFQMHLVTYLWVILHDVLSKNVFKRFCLSYVSLRFITEIGIRVGCLCRYFGKQLFLEKSSNNQALSIFQICMNFEPFQPQRQPTLHRKTIQNDCWQTWIYTTKMGYCFVAILQPFDVIVSTSVILYYFWTSNLSKYT